VPTPLAHPTADTEIRARLAQAVVASARPEDVT